MRRGQRRVAAEIHLRRRCEPAQLEAAIKARDDEGRLRQVHFPSHELHPGWLSRGREEAHRGGVAGEGLVGERIDDEERQRHPRIVP